VKRDGLLLLFGLARAHKSSEIPAFVANEETSEMVVVQGPQELAFPLHTRAVQEYFAERGR
jgi:hypothetical protein